MKMFHVEHSRNPGRGVGAIEGKLCRVTAVDQVFHVEQYCYLEICVSGLGPFIEGRPVRMKRRCD
jgi:hypothetical protein